MSWSRTGSTRTGTRDHKQRKKRVFVRDDYTCQLRLPGCTEDAEVLDHIDNTRGPSYETDANTQAACAHCNNVKARVEAAAGRRRQTASARYNPGKHPGLR